MEDFDRCYRAVQSRDARFDGWFFTAVTSTGVYCRPSCPARTPMARNVRFFPTAASAQQAGFRACLRCRPDAAPGSPEWLGRADVAARALRLVLDGVVDHHGVTGLARRLGYSERQLHRVLVAEVGTGALALARAQRANTARLLIETTDVALSQVAFGAGFASVRQFNDTVRSVFGRTPSELRRSRRPPSSTPDRHHHGDVLQTVVVRLAYRRPLAARHLFDFLGRRAVDTMEQFDGSTYWRTLRLTYGPGTVALQAVDGHIRASFRLADLRDLTTAIARCRHLCNLDADPIAVDEALGSDPLLAPLVSRVPGIRVPGSVDGFETAVRAIVGQQVSLDGARKILAKLLRSAGGAIGDPSSRLSAVFPTPAAVVDMVEGRPDELPMPAGRKRALLELSRSVDQGRIELDAGEDPVSLGGRLHEIAGIGPWTTAYITMRALGDPDAFLATDLGVRRAARSLGLPDQPAGLAAASERWRPWRAYAQMHLWSVPRGPSEEVEQGVDAA